MPARYPTAPTARRAAGLRLLALVALLAAVVPTGPAARAQAAYAPEFRLDVVTALAPDAPEPRLDVFTAMPIPSLRFLQRTDGFEATYAVTVNVSTADERGRPQSLVASRTFERTVRVPTYDATQDGAAEDRAVQALDLPPGRYLVAVSVEDGASGRSATRETAHVVAARTDAARAAGVAVSEPLLVERYDPAARTVVPTVGGAISSDTDAVTVYAEAHADAPTTLRATLVVVDQARERPSFSALLGLAPRQQAEAGAPVVRTERVELPAGRSPLALALPTADLAVGDYALTLRLETDAGAVVAETTRPLAVRWMGLEQQIADLDEAVAQLRYIARDRDLAALRRAETPEERLRLFEAFWARRDPTPGTPRNERMEEYYYRVAYANERYSRLRTSGWSTDRGEVYIRFGEPDFVETHPFNYGTEPYQVWTYERIGRRFVFVDDSGGGEFRLLVPIWDDRTRL